MKPTDEIDDPTWHDIFDRDNVIKFLTGQIQMAPCLVSRPGEGTYECRHDKLCRVCEWRRDVHRELVQTWHIEDGIW